MNALLLFTGHLKGVCQNQGFIQHYDTMCRSVFTSCDNVLITYRNMFGTVRNTRSYSLQKRRQPIDKCLRILKHKISDLKIKIIDEIFDNTSFGIAYPKRYIQMINTIRQGLNMVSSSKDIIIRMRPDSGIPGINGIWSLRTWKTLLRIPEYTIVQYGTWKVRNKNAYVNGDNCFAARWSTFVNFTFFWENEFYEDYLKQKPDIYLKRVFEFTMSTVAERHGYKLLPNQNSI
jgi:hypothetical protein